MTLVNDGAKSSTVVDMLRQRCPRCRAGSIFRYSIFRGFPRMCERCAVCDLKFQREEGYFLGAMYISFGLALVVIALIAVLLWADHRMVDHQSHDLGGRDYSCRSRRPSRCLPVCSGFIWIRPSIPKTGQA